MRLQHVSIVIPHDGADNARAFYGGVLGLEERDVPPKLDATRLIWFRTGGDCELHLMLSDEPRPESPHLCLVVEGELDAARARLEAAGVQTQTPTEIIGRPRFMCRDPFGNLVELTRFEE